jgi:magnesium chelatase subunit I
VPNKIDVSYATMLQPKLKNLGELKKAGYSHQTVKEEIRKNLIEKLGKNENTFPGIFGYEDTVIPDIEKALLSQHNILLLGLRGQAKTRLARQITGLMNEWIPVIETDEFYDDPFLPITPSGKKLVEQHGDKTPITWLHHSERYNEKLATPDVSIADLIGDIDPIKAANLKLNLSDEKVIHYGIIPRSNKCIFVINELPDLQARIQVALFNILQEGDIQIRGFKVRMPLDILFIFTANPEDYTNRGSIVTPLKDRIESQILTHYPTSTSISKAITQQESKLAASQIQDIDVLELMPELIEEIGMQARNSEFIDKKSGVSARLTIAANELLHACAERRMIINNEKNTAIRIGDLYGIIPALTGKMELVYEGEQEGPYQVAMHIIGKSIRKLFLNYFPSPEKNKKSKIKQEDPYKEIVNWFTNNNILSLNSHCTQDEYNAQLNGVPGLHHLVTFCIPNLTPTATLFFMEFALHGISEFSLISKKAQGSVSTFSDMLGSMLNFGTEGEGDFDEDDY